MQTKGLNRSQPTAKDLDLVSLESSFKCAGTHAVSCRILETVLQIQERGS